MPDLEKLFAVQTNKGLCLANKLTYRHIHFENNKMTVILAAQVLSLSVANAIDYCRDYIA